MKLVSIRALPRQAREKPSGAMSLPACLWERLTCDGDRQRRRAILGSASPCRPAGDTGQKVTLKGAGREAFPCQMSLGWGPRDRRIYPNLCLSRQSMTGNLGAIAED